MIPISIPKRLIKTLKKGLVGKKNFVCVLYIQRNFMGRQTNNVCNQVSSLYGRYV